MTKTIMIIIGVTIILTLVMAMILMKRISPLGWGIYGMVNASGGIAMAGYDPVAYHRTGKPMQGLENFTTDYNAVKWYFAGNENKMEFEKNPEKYIPAFGGFCAFAASKGFTAKVDPNAWRIEKGKLYLFNDLDMREKWESELDKEVIERAMKNWEKRKP